MSCSQHIWKEIWLRKGRQDTVNLKELDGFEKTSIDMHAVGKYIRDNLKISINDKVLEVGCGAGFLAQYVAPYCEYIGVDYTETLLKKHIELLGNYVIMSDANDLPFKDKYFDKTFAFSVFHYFPDKEYFKTVMKEMMRVTKKSIFIGDLPTESHDKTHLLYTLKDFEEYDGCIVNSKLCSNPNRFNVLIVKK